MYLFPPHWLSEEWIVEKTWLCLYSSFHLLCLQLMSYDMEQYLDGRRLPRKAPRRPWRTSVAAARRPHEGLGFYLFYFILLFYYFICCCAAAWLSPLLGLHQLHHLGVHVTTQDIIPEELWRWREPFWSWSHLQPVGFSFFPADRAIRAICVTETIWRTVQWS